MGINFSNFAPINERMTNNRVYISTMTQIANRQIIYRIIQHWKPSEIERVKVPTQPIPFQKELSDKAQLSFALRKDREQLLQDAKSLVEN